MNWASGWWSALPPAHCLTLESDAYFREHGELAYREYQDKH